MRTISSAGSSLATPQRIILALALCAPASAWALAKPAAAPAAKAAVASFDDDGPHAEKTSKKHGKHHKQPVFSGSTVPSAELRTAPLPRPSGYLHLRAVNFGEELEVRLYNDQAEIDPASLDKLNHLFRCRRTGTEKPIEPHLFEILSIVSDHYGGRTIELVSGFRNQEHKTSYHFHGSASDIRIPGVSEKELRKFVATLDVGGMGLGIYPKGGFIHVDVRAPEASYRWVDYSPPGSSDRLAAKAKRARHRSPNS